jgi:Fe-Mn family superoxide dismutase
MRAIAGRGNPRGNRSFLGLVDDPAASTPSSPIQESYMAFELPELPYAYDALEPYMSRETLEFHHDKHHKTYVDTANKLIQGTGLEDDSLDEVVRTSFKDPELKKLFNNAAQHWNHSAFWLSLSPKKETGIPGALQRRIESDLGGVDKFKKDFVAEGLAQFGSGWVWLVFDEGKLTIAKTGNADNPPALGKTPLLTCDVWEHAYYIDYRNGREKFLNAFVDHLINWDYAAEQFEKVA